MKELDSDVAGSSKDTQRIQPKTQSHIIKYWEICMCTRVHKGNRETYRVWLRHSKSRETWWSHRHNKYGRDPYVDQNPQSVACWHLNMLKKIKQVRRDPYWWIKKRSTKLISEYQDCHMQLWKKQNISDFKSLWKRSKIILPHREALRADLQQNNVYNPFSKKSKEMIREMGHVELFELCETIPKVQCSHCLFIGIKNCVLDWQRIQKKV